MNKPNHPDSLEVTKIDEHYATYYEITAKGQEHGILYRPPAINADHCIVGRRIPICRLTDDGLKIHGNATLQKADSRYAYAVSQALQQGAQSQQDYDADMAVEAAAKAKMDLFISKAREIAAQKAITMISAGTYPLTECLSAAALGAAMGDEDCLHFLQTNRHALDGAKINV